jgi:hypothetical protein
MVTILGAGGAIGSELVKELTARNEPELYRTGVFSHTTKEAISTLGIGHELDQLENEFTEEDKEQFATEATSQLFPDVDELITNISNKFMQVSGKASALTEAARGLRLERPESPTRSIHDALSLARETLASDLTQGIQADAARFCSEINLRISKAIVDAKTHYDYRIHHFRQERRRSYFTACALAGIVWLVGFFAFHHHERAAPKSAVGELVLGVLAGVILQVGTVLFVRWWKSLPKLLNRTEEEVHGKLSNDIREEISKALVGIKFDSLDEAALTTRLNQIYVHTLSVENTNWRSIAIDFLKSTRDVQANFVATRREQLAHIEELRVGALRYFIDPARNLSLLTGVALKIKERAIEPSFKLLDTTREQLLAVKDQVTTVSFD